MDVRLQIVLASVVTRSNAPYDAEGQNVNASVGYSVYSSNGTYDPAATSADTRQGKPLRAIYHLSGQFAA